MAAICHSLVPNLFPDNLFVCAGDVYDNVVVGLKFMMRMVRAMMLMLSMMMMLMILRLTMLLRMTMVAWCWMLDDDV